MIPSNILPSDIEMLDATYDKLKSTIVLMDEVLEKITALNRKLCDSAYGALAFPPSGDHNRPLWGLADDVSAQASLANWALARLIKNIGA